MYGTQSRSHWGVLMSGLGIDQSRSREQLVGNIETACNNSVTLARWAMGNKTVIWTVPCLRHGRIQVCKKAAGMGGDQEETWATLGKDPQMDDSGVGVTASNDRDLNNDRQWRSATKICLLDECAERMPVLQPTFGTATLVIPQIRKNSSILKWW